MAPGSIAITKSKPLLSLGKEILKSDEDRGEIIDTPRPIPADLQGCLKFAIEHYKLPYKLHFDYIELVIPADDLPYKAGIIKGTREPSLEAGSSEEETKIITLLLGVDFLDRPIKLIFVEPVPRTLMILINLVISNQAALSSIEVHGPGHHLYMTHEIKNMLRLSNLITDVTFDGAKVLYRDYYILLDEASNLKCLSCARCSITDPIVEEIVKRLCYGEPAAKNLRILNLSSNMITDDGAKAIAKMLETNRTLCYLNLCSNHLTDIGAGYLLKMLTSFMITEYEYRDARRRRLAYLIKKYAAKAFHDKKYGITTAVESDKNKAKSLPLKRKKSMMPTYPKESSFYYPEFDYPLFVEATPLPGGGAKVRGNDIICRLNLSYNRLTELTLKRAIPIMRAAAIGQRGLFLISVEGTLLPVSSTIQNEADELIDMQLNRYGQKVKSDKGMKRKQSFVKSAAAF